MEKRKRKNDKPRSDNNTFLDECLHLALPPAAVVLAIGTESLIVYMLLRLFAPYFLSETCNNFAYCTAHMTPPQFVAEMAIGCSGLLTIGLTMVFGSIHILDSWFGRTAKESAKES